MSFVLGCKWWEWMVVAVSALFGIIGSLMLGEGLNIAINPRGISPPSWIINDRSSNKPKGIQEGVNLAVSGAISLLVGLFGIYNIVARSRFFTIWYLVSLLGSVTLFFVFVIQIMNGSSDPSFIVNLIPVDEIKRTIETNYGSLASNRSLMITWTINGFQTDNYCCGWSNDRHENVFANTPYSRLVNEIYKSSKTTLAGRIVYPLSCCHAFAKNHNRDLCLRARDPWLARKESYIHAKDCLEILKSDAKNSMAILYIVLIIMKALCILVYLPKIIWPLISTQFFSRPTPDPCATSSSAAAAAPTVSAGGQRGQPTALQPAQKLLLTAKSQQTAQRQPTAQGQHTAQRQPTAQRQQASTVRTRN